MTLDDTEFYKYNCYYVSFKENCPSYNKDDDTCKERKKKCIWRGFLGPW